MPRCPAVFLASTLALALGPVAAQAPPIKPGLWQLRTDRLTAGEQPVDVGAQVRSLPPEAREQMQRVMKQKGIDMGAGDGAMKVCLDRRSLEQGSWQGAQFGCKTDMKQRNAKQWSWRSVCTNPPSESDGEATFHSDEAYTVKSRTRAGAGRAPQQAEMTVQAKWLGANCGDLKPMSPRTMNAPPQVPKEPKPAPR